MTPSASSRLAPARPSPALRVTARRAVILGDAHFDPTSDADVERLARFVARAALDADLLVVLGDLFDYWLGRKHLRLARLGPLREAFDAARQRGCRCLLATGNRDFLLDAPTAAALGAEHGGEWIELELSSGERWLLTHGDALCLDDRGYMRLRRITHSRAVHWLSRALPLWALRAIAVRLRRASQRSQARRREQGYGGRSFPIRPPAVEAVLADGGPRAGLVCGHVHLARHWVGGAGGAFLVLPAFERDDGHLVLESGRAPSFAAAGAPLEIAPRPVAPGALTYE
ncbi:MAG: metallophosphoesterase [Planctomycetes bacterium]|nr:metallophosphoesterase [Planctomycetota bacterium]